MIRLVVILSDPLEEDKIHIVEGKGVSNVQKKRAKPMFPETKLMLDDFHR